MSKKDKIKFIPRSIAYLLSLIVLATTGVAIGSKTLRDKGADYIADKLSPKFHTLIDENEVQKATIDKLTVDKTLLTNQVATLDSQVKTLTTEKATLTTRIGELNTQIATLTADKTSLTSQVETLTAEKQILTNRVAELTVQINTLTADKTDLESQITTLNATINALQTESNSKVAVADTRSIIFDYDLSTQTGADRVIEITTESTSSDLENINNAPPPVETPIDISKTIFISGQEVIDSQQFDLSDLAVGEYNFNT